MENKESINNDNMQLNVPTVNHVNYTENRVSSTFFSPASTQNVQRDKLHDESAVKLKLGQIPDEYQLGAAIGQGDCFFDALAQALNQVTKKAEFTAKSLRIICKEYLTDETFGNEWVKDAVIKNGDNFEQYLARIEFTANEIESMRQQGVIDLGSATWGNPHIEGRIICEILQAKHNLSVKLHNIEVHEESEEGVNVLHQLVDVSKEGGKYTVNSIEALSFKDYKKSPNLLHLVNYRLHFVPLLNSTITIAQIEKPFKSSQKRLYSNSNIVTDTNGPTAKKRRIETVPLEINIDALPPEIKSALIKFLDYRNLASIGTTNHLFKQLVDDYTNRYVKNLLKVMINVWLYGEIELIGEENVITVIDSRTGKFLLKNVKYNPFDNPNDDGWPYYYGTILEDIMNKIREIITNSFNVPENLRITKMFFCRKLLDTIKQKNLDINSPGVYGQSLLHFYCDVISKIDKDALSCIALLIENGANFFLKDDREDLGEKSKSPFQILVEQFVDRLQSDDESEKNIFPIFLVELMLKEFDETEVINKISKLSKDFSESGVLLGACFYLYNHSNLDIKNLFIESLKWIGHTEYLKILEENTPVNELKKDLNTLENLVTQLRTNQNTNLLFENFDIGEENLTSLRF